MEKRKYALYTEPVHEHSEPVFTTKDYRAACDYAACLSLLVLPGGREALREHLRSRGAGR